MIDRREETRSAMRKRRALSRSEAIQKTKATCERVTDSVDKARLVLTDAAFAEVLRSQGVQTVPRFLATTIREIEGDLSSAKERLDEVTLQFVIAWTFLFPLFANPAIKTHLDETWPGLVLELKDTFIALVVEGPFPHSMSGHVGRRRGAHNRAGPWRPADDKVPSARKSKRKRRKAL
jgi:hypothetical protein